MFDDLKVIIDFLGAAFREVLSKKINFRTSPVRDEDSDENIVAG